MKNNPLRTKDRMIKPASWSGGASRRPMSCLITALLMLVTGPLARADVPPPVISQFQPSSDGSVTLTWDAVAGAAYRVLTSTDLAAGAWDPVDYLIAETNSVTWQANGMGGEMRFYRLATEAIAIRSVEPGLIPTNTPTTIYITGQGFASGDTVTATGPAGTLTLSDVVIYGSSLISATAPPLLADMAGDYNLRVTSPSGKSATVSYAWKLVAAPTGSLLLVEPPEEPPASPDAMLAAYLSKKGYDYYQAQGRMSAVQSNPLHKNNAMDGGLVAAWLSRKGYDYYKAKSDLSAAGLTVNPYYSDLGLDGWTKGGGAAVGRAEWIKGGGASVGKWTKGGGASVGKPNPGKLTKEATPGDHVWTKGGGASVGITEGWTKGGGAAVGRAEWTKGGGASVGKWTKGGGASVGKPNPGREAAPGDHVWTKGGGASVGITESWTKGGGASVGKPSPGRWTRGGGASVGIDDGGLDESDLTIQATTCGANAPTVQLFSGEVQLQEPDLMIPGRGLDFVWARTYRSGKQGANLVGLNLAERWTHSYAVSATQTADGIAVADGTGRSDVYYPGTNGIYSRPEFFNAGRLSNSVFTLTFPSGGRWIFNPLDGSPVSGRLSQIVDRHGNAVSLSYAGSGRLAAIVDDLGRTNSLGYDSNGRLTTVTDFSGRSVSYQYYGGGETGGSPGDLKSVTSPPVTGTPNGNDFPTGKTTTYTYSTGYTNDAENHLLLTVIDAKGQTVARHIYQHYQTDLEFVRCLSAQDGTNDPMYYTYTPQTPNPSNHYATIKVTVRDAVGNVSECRYNSRNLPVDLREYTGRSPIAGPVTDASNRPINPVRTTDPLYYETQWSWNPDALCAQEIEPLGNSVSCVYERDFNPSAPAAKKGDARVWRSRTGHQIALDDKNERVRRFTHHPDFGSPALATIPAFMKNARKAKTCEAVTNVRNMGGPGRRVLWGLGGNADFSSITTFGLDFVTSTTDPNGIETTASYDSTGNRVKVHFHWDRTSAADEDFTYNTSGQLIAITNAPDGKGYRSVDTCTYYGSGPQAGYLAEWRVDTTGPTVIRTAYEYDPRGNVTRCIDPRTNDWLYVYNALDQVVQSSSAIPGGGGGSARYTTQYSYDANDNLTRVDVENRDSTGALDATSPIISTQFNYDLLNRMTSCWRDKNGHLVLRCTSCSYDANDNLTLFRSGEAVNGNNTNKVIQFLYDERNLLFCQIRAPGTTLSDNTDTSYDANGNLALVERTCAAGGCKQADRIYVHNWFDELESVTDAMGNVVSNRYDANGNVIARAWLGEASDVPGSAGNQIQRQLTFQWDTANRLSTMQESHFDAAGAPIGDGYSTTRLSYAANGDCQSVTDDNNHVTRYTYDTAGRLASEIDPKGNTIAYGLDASGNVLAVTQSDRSDLPGPAQVFTVTAQYDGLNRCIMIADNVGNTVQLGYDSRDNLARQTDANGNLSAWTYDGLSRCTTAVADLDGDGILDFAKDAGSLTAYDDNDCVLSITDANTNSTSFSYDALDRCALVQYADGKHRSASYDFHDNPHQVTDQNGSVMTYTYDLNDRCARKDIAPNGAAEVAATTTFETFACDGCSRLVLASNDVSRLTFTYDSLGDCLSRTQDGRVTSAVYDGVGNCTSMTYPSGRSVGYAYDAADQVTILGTSGGGLPPATLATYAYDGPRDGIAYSRKNGAITCADYNYKEHSRLARITRPNGINTRINWDGAVSPPNTQDDQGFQQVSRVNHSTAGGSPVIDQRRFAYDHGQNKILRAQMTEFATGQGTRTNIWSYDPLNQLKRAINTTGTGATVRSYHLDSKGNRLEVTNGPVVEVYTRAGAIPPGDFQMDRYTTTPFGNDQYDANGNLLQVSSAARQMLYVYDYANRLVFVYDLTSGTPTQVAGYTYDALGNRLSKTTFPPLPLGPLTTTYVHTGEVCDDGNDIIEEHENGALRFFAVWPHMHQTAGHVRISPGGAIQHVLTDDLGNALALTDASGNVLERYEYDDYGAPQFLTSDGVPIVGSDGQPVTSSPAGNPFLFHGMEWEPETGLYVWKEFSPAKEQLQHNPRNLTVYVDPKTGRSLSNQEGFCPGGGRAWPSSGYFDFNNNPWTPGGGETGVGKASKNMTLKGQKILQN